MLKKDVKDIDIGKAVKGKIKEKKTNKSDFAKEVGLRRTAIYSIFNNKSLDSDLLHIVSKFLEYNFFLEYFDSEKSIGRHILLIETDKATIEKIIEDLSSNAFILRIKS